MIKTTLLSLLLVLNLSIGYAGEVKTQVFISQEAVATSDTTTTSSSDVLLNAMTITPVAGTYLAIGSTCVEHSAQNVAVVLSLYAGGTQETSSVRSTIARTNALGAISTSPCMSTQALVTVSGAEAVELRWRTASGTATAHQRNLTVMRLQ